MSVFDDANNVAAWNCNELTGGVVEDKLGNGNDLTLTGATIDNVIKKVGSGSLSRDDVNDIITAANPSNFDIETTTPFGISTWVRLKGVIAQQTFWDKTESGVSVLSLGYQSNELRFDMAPSGTNRIIMFSTGVTFAVDTWYHVVCNYDGSEVAAGVKFYVDGVRTGTSIFDDDLAGSSLNAAPFRLGTQVDFLKRLLGNIDPTLVRIGSQFTDGGVAIDAVAGGEVAELWNGGDGLEYTAALPHDPTAPKIVRGFNNIGKGVINNRIPKIQRLNRVPKVVK